MYASACTSVPGCPVLVPVLRVGHNDTMVRTSKYTVPAECVQGCGQVGGGGGGGVLWLTGPWMGGPLLLSQSFIPLVVVVVLVRKPSTATGQDTEMYPLPSHC